MQADPSTNEWKAKEEENAKDGGGFCMELVWKSMKTWDHFVNQYDSTPANSSVGSGSAGLATVVIPISKH